MTKLLYITHLSGARVNRIWYSSIKAANELGFDFHLACNMSDAEHPAWEEDCQDWGIIPHQIDFDRNPLAPINLRAKTQLSALLKREKFDIVHCNTPVGGLLGRICAKENNVLSIIYQAHGFHFWKGAPLKNWMLYYPVEKWLARKTDVLITINTEDYNLAKKCFKPGKVEYVPGVGIDLQKFSMMNVDRKSKQAELGLAESDFVLLSIGELIPRKNHVVVLKALAELKKQNRLEHIQYLICGRGEIETELKKTAEELEISDHIHFLGFRMDINEICMVSDLFVFPSLQEGLPVALMEAMACGLPVICSNIRGNTDLIEDGVNGKLVENEASVIAEEIYNMMKSEDIRASYSYKALDTIKQYDFPVVVDAMKKIYSECIPEKRMDR